MTDLTVRRGRPDDAAGIAEVHVRSWQEGYRGLIAQDHLDGLDPAVSAVRVAEMLRHEPWPDGGTLIAVRDERIVGFVNFEPERVRSAQIQMMYVHPGSWRAGVGRVLIAEGVRAMTGAGYHDAWLWALAGAERTHAFYRATGWRTDGGRRTFTVGGRDYPVIRFRRKLDVPLSA